MSRLIASSTLASLSALRRAGDWFLGSGIQDPSGGVARYYRHDLGRNAAISTEITGYAASTLLFLGETTGEGRFTAAGLRAARFLADPAWRQDLATIPFEYPHGEGDSTPPAYFFDCGIIARAFLNAWRRTGEEPFLRAAQQCCDAMARDFVRDGVVHPILALPGKKPLPHEPHWSRSPGCYQLKAALAWLEFADASGRPEYRVPYESLLQRSLATQASFLPGAPDRLNVMDRLHAYCYFLEAVLPVADRAECRQALAEGIERVAFWLRDLRTEFVRSDVYAQLLRVRLYADALGAVALNEPAAREEAEAIPGFQCAEADAAIHGGFYFGLRRGEWIPYLNPVSTAFCSQALQFWQEYEAGAFQRPAWALI